ncbi:MAG: hypothetical protein HY319_13970 [Armatimonadetes bacterium]|nr:hypothetical protein [Armatimonadota bacterium]
MAMPSPSREDWLARSVLAGYLASALVMAVLIVTFLVVGLIASSFGPGIADWMANLTENPLVNLVQSGLFLSVLAHLTIGIGFAVVYARFAEPVLPGSSWEKGLLYSLAPFILSVVVFFPLVGAGLLGSNLSAGPLPVFGNLILHAVYGVVLGMLYGPAGDMLVVRTGSAQDRIQERQEMKEAAQGAAIGVTAGLVSGALLALLGTVLVGAGTMQVAGLPLSYTWATLVVFCSAMGCLLGTWMGLPTAQHHG